MVEKTAVRIQKTIHQILQPLSYRILLKQVTHLKAGILPTNLQKK